MFYPWDVCPCTFHFEMKKEYYKFLEIKNKEKLKKKK